MVTPFAYLHIFMKYDVRTIYSSIGISFTFLPTLTSICPGKEQ